MTFIFHIALFSDISKFFRRKFWWFRKDCVILLTDGINTFFAETTGNYAKAALGLKLEVGMTVNVHLVVDARKWQTQQGEDRYENRVTITNIARWE